MIPVLVMYLYKILWECVFCLIHSNVCRIVCMCSLTSSPLTRRELGTCGHSEGSPVLEWRSEVCMATQEP